jgi:type II secretory pathway pseudopilin PulG
MKLRSNSLSGKTWSQAIEARAFTLVELMVTMTIFMLLMLMMLGVQIFGFKINALTTSKLKSTAYSIKALDQIQGQVRGASSAVVGNGTSLASFTSTGTSGSALQINLPTGDVNLLYCTTNTGTLYEIFGANNNQITVATNLTNQVIFQTVDYRGSNISSSGGVHYAIEMTLQFFQQNFQVPTNVCEYYNFQTMMTPRTQN